MANIEQRATVNIDVNSKSAQNKLAQLSNKLDDLNKKKAAFEKAGDAKGMARMDTEIKKVEKSMNRVRTNAEKVDAAMKKLNKASPKELRMTLKQLQNDLEHIERGSDAWHKHTAAIKRVKAEIKAVDAELKEHQSLISRLNGTINNWGMSIASAVAAFTGLTMAGRQAVQAYAEMEAEMANVRKYTGMTAEEVEHLNEAFKGMDTRTTREDLNKLAQEAGRLGLQTEEDVLGFVRAADKINVALDDLGEGATLTLSKLTDIFGERERLGVEQSLLAVGSVINELSQNCTASAPYIAEFTSRLGGVGHQAGLSIQEIMGFAAVLDANNQKLEASATALSQVIVRLYQDPAKYAKVAGLDVKNFADLMKKDANAALIQFLEALNKAGGMDVLSPMFKDMGENGARAITALSTLASNIEKVKWEQEEASKAFSEATSIDKEYAVQNNTVQAQLDKAKNGFNETAVALGEKLVPVMRYAITGTSAMMKVLSLTVDFFIKYKGVILAATAAIITYRLAVNAANIIDNIHYALLVTKEALMKTHRATVLMCSVAYNRLTGNIVRANAAQKLLNTTTKMHPYGLLAAAIAAVIAGLIAFAKRTKEASEAQKEFNKLSKELDEERNRRMEQLDRESSKIKYLAECARDETQSIESRKHAIAKLNAIIPNYCARLDEETGKYYENKQALDSYLQSLEKKIRLEANRAEYERLIQEDERLRREIAYGEDAGKEVVNRSMSGARTRQQKEAVAHAYGANLDANGNVQNAPVSGETHKLMQQRDFVQKRIKKLLDFTKDIDLLEETPVEPVGGYTPRGGAGSGSKGGNSKSDAEREREKREREEKQRQEEAERERKEKDREEKQRQEEARRVRIQQYAEARDQARLMAEMEFNNIGNEEAWQNQRLLQQKRFEAEKTYLEKVRDEYEKGTDERARAEKDLARATQEEKLRLAKQMEEDLATWSLAYQQMSAKRRIELEEATIDTLVQNEKISTEEAERAKAEIRRKYRDELNSKTGTTAKNQGMTDAAATMDAQIQELEAAYNQGLISEEDYQSRRWQIIKNYHDKVAGLINGEGSEWASMVVNFQQALTSALENLGSTWEEKLKSITDITQAAFAIMGAGLQQYTAYAAAERDLEVAKVTESYDKQIAAAGNNQKKTKKLEEKKQKEIAKIKSAYNKKAQTIEIAQAIASTAMAAINAYASASKVSWILGPIAAAMATAAGALQIATIRKQHQAEAAGYYEGGYTPRDRNNRREVGVVHANEFVANHEAVANPNLAPVLRMIDEAQRTNTVGSLTAEDVSRAIGQGRILGQTVAAQQQMAAHGDQGLAVVAASVQEQTDAIARLQQAIDDGIEAYVVMDGERGLDKQYKRYQRLTENPRR